MCYTYIIFLANWDWKKDTTTTLMPLSWVRFDVGPFNQECAFIINEIRLKYFIKLGPKSYNTLDGCNMNRYIFKYIYV